MSLRIALPLALAGCLALAGPSPGVGNVAGPVKPLAGKFKGRTAQHKAMSIKVSRRHVVTTVRFNLRLNCNDGSHVSFSLYYKNFAVPIAGGTFNRSVSDTSDLGYPYTVTISGSFPSKKRATGTISLGVTRADRGGGCITYNPGGSHLGPGPVKWKARRQATTVG
jgi:hypothetical protein